MDSIAIQTKLQQINSLVVEVLQSLPGDSNDSEQQKIFPEKTGLNSVPLFDGFDVHNDAHACYLLLCHKAGSNLKQSDIVKQYLSDANKPTDRAEVDRLRKAVDYLCKSKQLAKPWRDKPRETASDSLSND